MAGKKRLFWKSPALPVQVFEDDDLVWRVHDKAGQLWMSDTPSTNDLRYAFHRYNQATPFERDAMDSAFVWFTGYTLASIVEMVRQGNESEVSKGGQTPN